MKEDALFHGQITSKEKYSEILLKSYSAERGGQIQSNLLQTILGERELIFFSNEGSGPLQNHKNVLKNDKRGGRSFENFIKNY
jgi:hypothetical protein